MNSKSKLSWLRSGFSLIEVMVTLAIIGIITSIILPSYHKIQSRAKHMAVKSVARTIQLAVEGYKFDEGDYPTGKKVTMAALAKTLSDSGDLSQLPKNPYTGKAYTATDTKGKIDYSKTSDGYELKVYGNSNTELLETLQHF